MEKLNWTMSLSVGNALLDQEHRELLDMVRDIEHTMRLKKVSPLADALTDFARAMRKHFDNESKIAAAIDHPFERNQQEHEYVLNEIAQMLDELRAAGERWSESAAIHYLVFLSTWASEHIRDDDMLMKPKLQLLSYSFASEEEAVS